MEAKELLKKIQHIELKAKMQSKELISGGHISAFKGSGMTFSEVKNYTYGDEIRTIDWNVTARFNEPFVKSFEEEREQTTMLLLDGSASMWAGTGDQTKWELAVEIAATIAFSAQKKGDKVGLIVASDTVETFIPPQKGKKHILQIIRFLILFQPKNNSTDLNPSINRLNNFIKRSCATFIISDFNSVAFEKSLKNFRQKHQCYAIQVECRLDYELPRLGCLPSKTLELGKEFWSFFNKSNLAYRNTYEREKLQLEELFKRAATPLITVQPEEKYHLKLSRLFR